MMVVKRTEEPGARMGIRGVFLLILSLCLVSMTTGCGEDEVSTAPTTADYVKDRAKVAERKANKRKGGGAAVAQTSPSVGTVSGKTSYANAAQDYFYDPRGKRDPFRSYRSVEDDSGSERAVGPLGDFELGQLELSAVIWDATNPRALILDPGGRSYIVREGAQIGKNNGQVIHIGDNLVLVKETYENFAGERTTKDVELRIRLSQGG